MSPDYDVIVAGAGLSGSFAAMSAAKAGAKVLLLDRNNQQEPGKKTNWGWVCGDAVARSHLEFVNKKLGVSFSEPELDMQMDSVYALSPDLENKFVFEGHGYILDRPKFARKIVSLAVKSGAEYRPNYEVEGPILENGAIVGVFGKDDKKKDYKISSKVVVDCLGMASTLRRKLPINDFIQKDIKTDDIESTGRYIMKIEQTEDNPKYYDPKNALIHLNPVMTPGGYGWVFPKSGRRVNIGVGIEKKSIEVRNAKLGKNDTLHTLMDQYVDWNKAIKNAGLDDTDNNGKGYWSVSVRRPIGSLVYTNYLGAGDSAAMPNPLSAGGIGPAMISGTLAGQVAAEAVSAKDTSMEFLWKYNIAFNEAYGNKTAALEAFRVYLQSLNTDLINYGMAHFITQAEAESLSYGRIPEITIASKFTKLISGMANISAFKNLLFTVDKMKKLLALYKQYPKDPASFRAWNDIVLGELNEVKAKFPPSPV